MAEDRGMDSRVWLKMERMSAQALVRHVVLLGPVRNTPHRGTSVEDAHLSELHCTDELVHLLLPLSIKHIYHQDSVHILHAGPLGPRALRNLCFLQ